MKKFLLIINPASGRTAKNRIIAPMLDRLNRAGIDYDVAFTRRPGHGRELAAQAAAEGRYAVIACGGDGTVNEIASALVGTDTAMAIIPTGSGNGLARHLGIPVDIYRSIKVISEQNIISADYGTANGYPFFCTFGTGFDAAVSERCAREKRRGLPMYIKNMLTEFIKYKPEEYVIELDGKVITERAFLVVCCNASQYGNNAFIAPHASVTDGMLDITVAHTGNLAEQAIVGIDLMLGIIRDNAFVDTFRANHVRIIRRTEGAAHIDGDAISLPEVIDVRCHPAKIKLFAPTKDTEFRPVVTPTALFFRDIGSMFLNIFPISLPHKRLLWHNK